MESRIIASGRQIARVFVAIAISALWPAPTRAAIENRAILKTYFETGDVPTQDQFSSLIDSMVNFTDDRYLIGLRTYDPAPGAPGVEFNVKRFGIGTGQPASPLGIKDPRSDSLHMAPDFAGQFGFAAILLGDSSGNMYAGYLQLQMDPLGGSDPRGPGIHVQYVVYNDEAGQPVTTQIVPEPAAAALLLCGAAILMNRRRRDGTASSLGDLSNSSDYDVHAGVR